MARPTKEGIDYFSFDVAMDTKVELLEAEFGLKGFAVFVKLLQRIYGEHGYYCEWNDEVALLFSKKIGEGCNVVSEIVQASIKRGLFNEQIFLNYGILTSGGIQKRFFEAVKRRTEIEVIKEYLLVHGVENKDNVCNKSINVCNNSKNVSSNTQSKGNERKEKENKEKNKDVAGSGDYFGNHEVNALFLEFLELRKKLKCQNTDHAVTLLVNKLNKCSDDDKIQALENAIMNSWKSVYPDSKQSNKKSKSTIEPISESRKQAYVDATPEFAGNLWEEFEVEE